MSQNVTFGVWKWGRTGEQGGWRLELGAKVAWYLKVFDSTRQDEPFLHLRPHFQHRQDDVKKGFHTYIRLSLPDCRMVARSHYPDSRVFLFPQTVTGESVGGDACR